MEYLPINQGTERCSFVLDEDVFCVDLYDAFSASSRSMQAEIKLLLEYQ
jgi:hypothetical protein